MEHIGFFCWVDVHFNVHMYVDEQKLTRDENISLITQPFVLW